MKERITLLARVAGKFEVVQFKKDRPIPPVGASSYYARFTEDGKRVCKPLGKDLTGAFIAVKNLELTREFQRRDLPMTLEVVQAHTVVPKESVLAKRIDAYLEETSSNKARKTWLAYRNTLNLFKASCKAITVEQVTREDVLAFKIYLRGQEFSERSIFNNFLNLMIFLKWCGASAKIKQVDWPRKAQREPEEYTEEEIKAILTVATDEERLMINCFLCSGLRSGELAHLTYGDIDFTHSVWTVQPKKNWNTKTEHSQRDVPVPEWLTAKIKERMKIGTRGKSDLIFFNGGGKPNMHMLRITKSVAERAKVTGRVDDHKFRSTAITRWLRDGNTVPDVMAWVGHMNPAMILRYAAKVKVRQAETLKKASGAFANFAGVGD